MPVVAPTRSESIRRAAGTRFRAGFLAGLGAGLDQERAAQLGCLLATLVLETRRAAGVHARSRVLCERLSRTYGPAAAQAFRVRETA